MSCFPCVGAGGWSEDPVSFQLPHSHARVHTAQKHSNIQQYALIKHSHYTQEEIPAGAVYQSLVHFLLLLLNSRPHVSFFPLPPSLLISSSGFIYFTNHKLSTVGVCHCTYGVRNGLLWPFLAAKKITPPKKWICLWKMQPAEAAGASTCRKLRKYLNIDCICFFYSYFPSSVQFKCLSAVKKALLITGIYMLKQASEWMLCCIILGAWMLLCGKPLIFSTCL